jgi:hypothetical protein
MKEHPHRDPSTTAGMTKERAALPFAMVCWSGGCPNFQFESAAIWAVRLEVRVSHISRPNNGREIWGTLWSVALTEPKSRVCAFP